MSDHLESLVDEITPLVVGLRRTLHRVPEPGHQEFRTTELLAESLAANGVEPRLRASGTGLWAESGPGPTVGFRADIDGLPIVEPEDHDPRSENPGWMHACGHDAHAAIGVGIAIVMARLGESFRFLFQPAEEKMPGGARMLVEEGLVDDLSAIIAFHVDPFLEPGKVGIKSGPITASADGLRILLEGPGGHTSRPHNTVDLVAAAARVVTSLPAAIREAVDPDIPVVTAFGAVHGGDASNVIPTRIELRGTVRTGDRALWGGMGSLVDRVLAPIVAATGAEYTLDYVPGVAPVINDEGVISAVTRGIASRLGEEHLAPTHMSMGGEDFFEYLDLVPGALLRLGVGSGGGDIHSATFRIDESAVGFGVAAGCSALLELQTSRAEA
jgi:amidohydrolase